MELIIHINKNKKMEIGDSKQVAESGESRFNYYIKDHLESFVKKELTLDSNIEEFFERIQSSIKSYYIVNNDLFFIESKDKIRVDSLVFMIFLKDDENIFNNRKNVCIYVKTNFDEEKESSFEFNRVGILDDFDEKHLSENGYKNCADINLIFSFSKRNSFQLTTSMLKQIVIESHKESNIFKSGRKQQNGMVKLDKTLSFYTDYISKQKRKYDRSNLNNIFPIVLRMDSENEVTKFLMRIETPEHNSEFVDVVNNGKTSLYFYNTDDSEEKIVLDTRILKFKPFDMVGLLEKHINDLKKIIDENNKSIKLNDEKYLNKDKRDQIDNLNTKIIYLNEEISNLESEIEDLNSQVNKKSKKHTPDDNNEDYEMSIVNLNLTEKRKELKIKNDEKSRLASQYEEYKKEYDFWEKENEKLATTNSSNQKIITDSQETIWKQKGKFDYYEFSIRNSELKNLRIEEIKKIHISRIKIVRGYLSKIFKENNNFIITDEDYGSYSKHKRFYNSLRNFKSGQYKNPLLAKSIENPQFFSVNEENINDYSLNLPSVIRLNDKQEQAVKKAILTPCLSYLQGPPGTGKTQSVSALIYHIINNKHKNVLLMSSTHEAILNAFDRINELTEDDPNFIFYKTIRKRNDKNIKTQNTLEENDDVSNIFDLDHAFYNFSLSIIKHNLKGSVKN
ncbi:hypothetical protein NXS15_03580 [Mycoplasma sp. CSL7475-4]|uniref:AAA domain-containing protein n=1 Tax=Mycoplasma sp. CSL7475-4 TaxID=2973942 RepID=UPI00216ABAF6|nr:AAA domain-containing protein [Mycoplasma sp. CSL7475-4]MCS4537193.1 hypothetical protein [Mycoplasma sp. CSL7475-4]